LRGRAYPEIPTNRYQMFRRIGSNRGGPTREKRGLCQGHALGSITIRERTPLVPENPSIYEGVCAASRAPERGNRHGRGGKCSEKSGQERRAMAKKIYEAGCNSETARRCDQVRHEEGLVREGIWTKCMTAGRQHRGKKLINLTCDVFLLISLNGNGGEMALRFFGGKRKKSVLFEEKKRF